LLIVERCQVNPVAHSRSAERKKRSSVLPPCMLWTFTATPMNLSLVSNFGRS